MECLQVTDKIQKVIDLSHNAQTATKTGAQFIFWSVGSDNCLRLKKTQNDVVKIFHMLAQPKHGIPTNI